MADYYIKSTAYSIVERETKKKGVVYDAVMYVAVPGGELKQRRIVSGCQTKKELKQKQAEFVANYCEIISKVHPNNEKPFDGTIEEAYRQYISYLPSQIKESSVVRIKFTLESYVLPEFQNKKLSEITKADLYKWQDDFWEAKSKTGKPLSYSTLSNGRSFFSSFLSWCEDRYDIPNQLKRVKKPKRRVQKTEMKIWTQDEFKKFLSVIKDPMWRALFATLFYTGRRRGEVIALTKEDITDKGIYFYKSLSFATLNNRKPYTITSTKAEKKYTTPICQPLRKELANYTPQEPFFFGGQKPIPRTTLQRQFALYTNLAGLHTIRIHDLRHSFVSMLIHLGANYNVIADLIGDTVEQVIKTYGHLYESDKIKVIEMLK